MIYIYVDGSDLGAISEKLLERIETFVDAYAPRVQVVDQREETVSASEDLPNWDLGVNFDIDALTDSEKKDLLLFFQILARDFERDFVLGGLLPSGQVEDFLAITGDGSLDAAIEFLLSNKK